MVPEIAKIWPHLVTLYIGSIRYIREELLRVANVDSEAWTTVPMQGSGTFAVEAVLQTAMPRNDGRVRSNSQWANISNLVALKFAKNLDRA